MRKSGARPARNSKGRTAPKAASPPPVRRRRATPERASEASGAIEVLQQFRELFRVSQQHFQRIEARCGISGAQLWALSVIGRTPGLRISELAQALTIHLSTASNLLDKLEAKGLIRRERGSGDQRVVRIQPTAPGQALLRRAPNPAAGVIPDALSRMPDEALQQLRDNLDLLLGLAQLRSADAKMRLLADS
jgi:DNA-binding MarR family transcriptional regulator